MGDGEVAPGDWIVGDVDGALAIPAASYERVVARAREIVATEDAAWARVRGGRSLFTSDSQYGAPLGEKVARGARARA